MKTLFIGQSHEVLHTVDSTNTYLKQLSKGHNLKEGYLVSTKYQTLGRGQFGNSWKSKNGQNMLLSVYLSPSWLQPMEFFYLNMSVCLAVLDTVSTYVDGAVVKWPNDIWFKRKKLAGILIENQISGRAIDQTIVGVGLNVNQVFDETAFTSIKQLAGKEISLREVIERFCVSLEKRYQDLKKPFEREALKREYLSKLYGYKTPVPVYYESKKGYMQITDVGYDGKLHAVSDANEPLEFVFKEVRFLAD